MLGQRGVMLRAAAALILCSVFTPPAFTGADINWQDRVLPLPQEMEVERSVQVRAGDTGYAIKAGEEAPPCKTARELLDSFALAGEGEGRGFNIELVLLEESPRAVPAGLAERLRKAPNADQAYAVTAKEGSTPGLTLAANTPVGLLYAARTLAQLVKPGDEVTAGTRIEIPLAEIVDWPDIAQRGEWGSFGYSSLGWYSQWKMNMHRLGVRSRFESDDDKLPRFSFSYLHDPESTRWMKPDRSRGSVSLCEFLDWAKETGYALIPYIGHLGHRSEDHREWERISPPFYPEGYARPRGRRGFCWTDEGIYRVLTDHMRRMADTAREFPAGSRDMEIWLTEHYSDATCYCEGCGGENTFILEARGIIRAYGMIREDYPDVRLRILLGQGSRNVNDRIIELAAADDVGVSYYDGIYTYITDREPMIFTELAEFAGAGGLADVVPQVVPCYSGLVPGSMAGFIRFRAKEFAGSNLKAATAYSMGGQWYYELNMAAWAEYTWNSLGRSTEDFSRAYATITGIAEPGLFARWSEKAGEAAWELAVSGYMDSMGRARYARFPAVLGDDEFQGRNTVRPGRALGYARGALGLARESGNAMMLAESEFTLAALESIRLRTEIQRMIRAGEDAADIAEILDRLDICAQLARAGIYEWYRLAREKQTELLDKSGHIRPPGIIWPLPERLLGYYPTNRQNRQAHALLRASDVDRQTASLFGIPDTRGKLEVIEVAEWDPGDFERGAAVIGGDISADVPPEGGDFNLGVNILEGSGFQMHSVTLSGVDSRSGERRILSSERVPGSVGGGGFYDYLMRVPEREIAENILLEIRVTGGGAGSTGYATIRRVWTRDDFPEEKIELLME